MTNRDLPRTEGLWRNVMKEPDDVLAIPPRKTAKPWLTVTPSGATRSEILRTSKYHLGRALWRRWS